MADTTNITILNGVSFIYEYKVSNDAGSMSFNDSAVIALELEDSLFNPFMNGSITLANNYNYIESDFVFRGDGTDKIFIKLKPNTKDTNAITGKEKIIEQTFTIVEEFNYIDDGTQAKNRKTYTFIHTDESIMRELFPYEKQYFGKAGDIIKEILSFDLPFKTGELFEPGNFTISGFPESIIPTMPFRYLDIIFYLLKYYYYIDGDLPVKGFLRLDRNTGEYQLLTLSKDFFAKSNKLVYEAFHSGDLVSNVTVNPNNPPDSGAPTKVYINNVVSTNTTVPGTAISNTHFMNALVVGYDHIYGSSRIRKVLIDSVRKAWKKKFVDVFSAISGKVKQHLNLTDYKKTKEFKIVRLPFEFGHNINITVADMVCNFAFYNQQMNINVVGDIGREPGTFLDIYKSKNDNSKGDEITLGRWFITGVRHLKLQNTYRNEIFCSKTYAGPSYIDTDSRRKVK